MKASKGSIVCPYCGNEYTPEEHWGHDEKRAENCDQCGKRFIVHAEHETIFYYTATKPGEGFCSSCSKWYDRECRDKILERTKLRVNVPFGRSIHCPYWEEADEFKFFYHATYKPFLKSIFEHGLGGEGACKNWIDSKSGVVYLATTPEVAESYAECGVDEKATISKLMDDISFTLLSNIVVLAVDITQLDTSKLTPDENNRTCDGSTWEYHGVIPASALTVLK